MKIVTFFLMLMAVPFLAFADAPSFTRFCPHFSTNTAIIWQAPMTQVPKKIWIYKRLPPHPFSAAVIANAMTLASLQNKGFPKPSMNDFNILENKGADWPGPIFAVFSMSPTNATLYYHNPNPGTNSAKNPMDKNLVQRAWADTELLGLYRSQMVFKNMTSDFNHNDAGDTMTNQWCGRGVFLSRQLDGILFWGNGQDGQSEGFWIDFGSVGEITTFSLTWPELRRHKNESTATPQEMMDCIRAQKVIVMPNDNETKYFERIKVLEHAQTFTVTKITPYYHDGNIDEISTNDETPQYCTPFAELEAVADFGNSNMTVRIFSPLLKSGIRRLMQTNGK